MEKDSKSIHKSILDVFLAENNGSKPPKNERGLSEIGHMVRNKTVGSPIDEWEDPKNSLEKEQQQQLDNYQLKKKTREERIEARQRAKDLADMANEERAERNYTLPDQKIETGPGDVKVVRTTPSQSTVRDPNVMDVVKGTPFMDEDYRGTIGTRSNQEYSLGYIDTPFEDSEGKRIFPNNPETAAIKTPKVKKESVNYFKNKLAEHYYNKLSENTSDVTKQEDNINFPESDIDTRSGDMRIMTRLIKGKQDNIPNPNKGKLEKAEGRGRSSTDPKALPYHPKYNPSGYRPGEEPGRSTK